MRGHGGAGRHPPKGIQKMDKKEKTSSKARASAGKTVSARRDGGQKPPSPKQRRTAAEVLRLLKNRYPAPETHLTHHNPWELLTATVLAAQCTDERVNTVTPALFARWPGPEAMAKAEPEEVEEYVRPTGFYHNKAKNLVGAARRVMDAYGGSVPDRMEDLITLPGVARKTANVVLWGAFGINAGLAVDTHVGRIAYRLGLTASHDPVRAERDLMLVFPREEWGNVNHRMVWFGRHVCKARGPLCGECEMAGFCEKNGMD